MQEITDESIRKAVKSCHWRSEIGGISVCKGYVGVCERVIETGKCDTLIELFQRSETKLEKQE